MFWIGYVGLLFDLKLKNYEVVTVVKGTGIVENYLFGNNPEAYYKLARKLENKDWSRHR